MREYGGDTGFFLKLSTDARTKSEHLSWMKFRIVLVLDRRVQKGHS